MLGGWWVGWKWWVLRVVRLHKPHLFATYLDGREVLLEERVDHEPVGEGAVAHDERVACEYIHTQMYHAWYESDHHHDPKIHQPINQPTQQLVFTYAPSATMRLSQSTRAWRGRRL